MLDIFQVSLAASVCVLAKVRIRLPNALIIVGAFVTEELDRASTSWPWV